MTTPQAISDRAALHRTDRSSTASYTHRNATAEVSLIHLHLVRMMEDVERAKARCDVLVAEYASRNDYDGERTALHVRTRLAGLKRQAEAAALVVAEITEPVRKGSCPDGLFGSSVSERLRSGVLPELRSP